MNRDTDEKSLQEELRQQADSEAERIREEGFPALASKIEDSAVSKLEQQDFIEKLKEKNPDASKYIDSMYAGLQALEDVIKHSNEGGSQFKGSIDPAGDVLPEENLVVEPLGDREYVYNYDGDRGISTSQNEEVGDGIEIQYLEIGEDWFKLDGKPLTTQDLIYQEPSKEKLQDWIEGKKKSKSGKQIYNDVKLYLETFLDLPREHHYDVATITALQSWCRPAINTVFYLAVAGAFGSGKTALLEALEPVFYHGKLAGSMTESGLRRAIERLKLSPLYDELDVETGTTDSIKYRSLRQGYRKGNQAIMANAKSHKLESFDTFGSKAFSLHGDIERALKQRSIPISIAETEDKRLPVVNQYKRGFGKSLATELLIWYLENISQAVAEVSEVSEVAVERDGDSKNADEIRQEIYDAATEDFNEEQLEFLQDYSGRVSELAYISNRVSEIFNVNTVEALRKSFEFKSEMELEYDDDARIEILRDMIVNEYELRKENLEKQNSTGTVWIKRKEIKKDFDEEMNNRGLEAATGHTFKRFLRELGFTDEVNYKKVKVPDDGEKKSLKCLLIDKKARRKLGIEDGASDSSNFGNRSNSGNRLKKVRKALPEKGASKDEQTVINDSGIGEEEAESILQELSKDGVIFQPKPGVIERL